MTKLTALAAAAALCALGSAATAQNMSASEILSNLQAQQAGAAARAGTTRGVSVDFGGGSGATGQPADVAAGRAETDRSESRVSPVSLPSEPPVVPEGEQVNLKITFETNSAFIRPGQTGVLTELCTALTEAPSDWSFNIIGHADAAGNDLYNLRLSEARAREVRRYLSQECGVSAARLNVYGVGESRPLPNVPPVSEENRRVEIQFSAS